MTYLMPYLLELSGRERIYIQNLIAQMPLRQAEVFLLEYRRRRKDPQTVLLAAVIGMVACPGFQRFWLGEVGMGLLFLFTAGFLAMGSIIDLCTYRTLARCHNEKVARQILTDLNAYLPIRTTEYSAPQVSAGTL
jgi:TM2 domain-containing membrane protein YozV